MRGKGCEYQSAEVENIKPAVSILENLSWMGTDSVSKLETIYLS
jgi:hypothetical protein